MVVLQDAIPLLYRCWVPHAAFPAVAGSVLCISMLAAAGSALCICMLAAA